jgi:hypothetical protein
VNVADAGRKWAHPIHRDGSVEVPAKLPCGTREEDGLYGGGWLHDGEPKTQQDPKVAVALRVTQRSPLERLQFGLRLYLTTGNQSFQPPPLALSLTPLGAPRGSGFIVTGWL